MDGVDLGMGVEIERVRRQMQDIEQLRRANRAQRMNNGGGAQHAAGATSAKTADDLLLLFGMFVTCIFPGVGTTAWIPASSKPSRLLQTDGTLPLGDDTLVRSNADLR